MLYTLSLLIAAARTAIGLCHNDSLNRRTQQRVQSDILGSSRLCKSNHNSEAYLTPTTCQTLLAAIANKCIADYTS